MKTYLHTATFIIAVSVEFFFLRRQMNGHK